MINLFRSSCIIVTVILVLSACAPVDSTPSPMVVPTTDASVTSSTANLAELKSYVETQTNALHTSIIELKAASDRYYELAKAANFDYSALWNSQSVEVTKILTDARTAFLSANPQYEQMEGVIAGVPSLSQYDVILDAGLQGSDGNEDAVPFDLTLPDGSVLPKPGNMFEITESTLWGTDPEYAIANIYPDFNNNDQVDLGDVLPDANILKGMADTFVQFTEELEIAVNDWQPTQAEAFGALLANVPTFTDFMEGWKNSRFVMGEASTERGFVATSRLSDLSDNILSWQKIYAGLSPAVKQVASDQDAQISRDLVQLQKYVSDLYDQESIQGKQFSPEEVDLLNTEGQSRATSIAGQIAQVAAKLDITIEE